MSAQIAFITDAATDQIVEVEFLDEISVDILLDIEEQWATYRQDLRMKLRTSGISVQDWPESLHWDWARKSLRLAFRDPNDFRLMAICHNNVYQGVIITLRKGHRASLQPDTGKPLIYVEFLEAAPWNWTIRGVQNRKFKGIGPLLLRAAVTQSVQMGWDGRTGLHALPQAMSFYEHQGFRFVSNDPGKENLPYYELSAADASARIEMK